MTSWRAAWAAVLSSAAVLALVACGDDDGIDLADPAAPESAATSAAPSTPAATTTPEEQAVLAAYEAFYQALAQARANPAEADTILAPVATGLQYERLVSGIKGSALAGEEIFGEPVINPQVVSVEESRAVVHDCQDTSAVGRRVIETGEVLTVGRNPDSAKSTLEFVDGTWKVATTEFVEPTDAFCQAG